MANPKSISGQVGLSTRVLTIVLVLPAVISLVLMLAYAGWYQTSVSRMELVASLKPMVLTEIPEKVWMTVSGRSTYAETGVYAAISRVNQTLESLSQHDESGQLELVIARRTMETLEQYVRQIEHNMLNDVPIVESEATLEEVRNVASLVDSMLEDYITSEISATAERNKMMTTIVMVSAVAEALLIVGALLLSGRTRRRMERFIHEPIQQLEHFSGLMAGGNLQARVPPTTVTELESLTEKINIMADRLESLIEQNRREQDNLRKSELRTLQAQINPHFLYNTLDAIIWQAEAGHSGEVIALTRALSDFFRISLSSGADWIPVSQEMKHLAGYLSIQKTRYRDILTYQIDVDEDMGEAYILKLLLQPLVENALYHGIKFKRGGGRITVTSRREGDFLCFCVQDTGKGMTEAQLREVTTRMRSSRTPVAAAQQGGSSGFGLSNVDQRLRLYYGLSEGLHIESGSGGTTVRFRVPAKGKEVARE